MIEHPLDRRRAQQARSQVALEVILVLYSLFATMVVIRTILILLDVSERVWIGRMVLGTTAEITDRLEQVPGFGGQLLGPLSLVDLVLLALVVLFPLGLIAASPRR